MVKTLWLIVFWCLCQVDKKALVESFLKAVIVTIVKAHTASYINVLERFSRSCLHAHKSF